MSARDEGGAHADALRAAFDRSFAVLPAVSASAGEPILAVRVGGHAHAVRVREIGGIFVDRAISPVPTSARDLLGIVALRGQLAPVYDLAVLLGWTDAGRPPPRWFVLAAGSVRVALAFDAFEGAVWAEPARLVEQATGGGGSVAAFTRGALRVGDDLAPIVHVPTILEALGRRVRPTTGEEER